MGAFRETTKDAFNDDGSQNPYYEGLLKMQKDDPEKYAKLSPAQKMSVGYYAESKEKLAKENNQKNG